MTGSEGHRRRPARIGGTRAVRLHFTGDRALVGSFPMGYGVIGSPTGSGPVSLGSSPGTPATCAQERGTGMVTASGPRVDQHGCTWPRRLAAQDAALSRR